MLDRLQLKEICQIAIRAGDSIMEHYSINKMEISEKSDSTPVTVADLAAHNVIVEGLSSLPFNFPILSEEASIASWDIRKNWKTYWLIDPLDGTKEFINQNGEFTVNIALIDNGTPIAGIVYAPALNQCFYGIEGEGAWCAQDEKEHTLPCKFNLQAKLKIVGSRSHQNPEVKTYLSQFDDYELVAVGSSLKFCLLAAGEAHLYPRLGPTSEWDTAAGQAVLVAAGGQVNLLNSNEPLRYNQKEEILNPQFLATAKNFGAYNMENEV